MKHSVKVTGFLVVMFLLAQLIGLKIVHAYIDLPASQEAGEPVWKDLPSVAGVEVERPDVEPSVSVWYIVLAVLLGTLMILLIVHFGRALLWKLWFFVAIVLCLEIALAAFMPAAVALVVALAAGWLKIFHPNVIVHNVSELFIYGGLAAIFVPMLNVLYAFVLLVLLSLYDMYAVWRSKHMIKMAKFQTKSGIFAGLLLPYKPVKRAKKGKPVRVKTAVLGGGDIGFPLIFSGTVLGVNGAVPALLVSLGATVALAVLLYFSQKDKFYPAMPFLTAGCVAGFLLTFL